MRPGLTSNPRARMIGFVRDNDVTENETDVRASEAPHFLCCLNAGRYSKPNVPFELD
jgi:hypothetical protein